MIVFCAGAQLTNAIEIKSKHIAARPIVFFIDFLLRASD
jgi:hypothetical protein